MGASAVLLFAVPSSPLAQPWPVIGGNVLSVLAGVAAAQLVPNDAIAAGVAVGGAILLMSLTRCLHPPGGAAALLAVVGGPEISDAGYMFALLPIGLNATLLTVSAIIFNRLAGAPYPARRPRPPAPVGTADPPPQARIGFRREDIESAVADIGRTFDISNNDLTRILRRIEERAMERTHGRLTCDDIMSRDVVTVDWSTLAEQARRILIERRVRTLPVLVNGRRVVGQVGLREVATATGPLKNIMSPPVTAAPNDNVLDLVPLLTDAHRHAAIIVDGTGGLLGLVTQTDLLVALSRVPPLDVQEAGGSDG